VTPAEVSAALAPVRWPRERRDARAIVVAVTLADPLWRVAEAARAHTDAECSCLAVNWTHDDDCALVTTEAALRDALAALAATREELP